MFSRIVKSEFFKASFWIFLATGFSNAGSYLYHLLMGRLLGPENYGILYSSISLLYDISIITLPFSFVIIKFISSYKGKGDKNSISSFYYFLQTRFLLYGGILSILLLVLSPLITSFLHLPSILFAILTVVGFYLGLFPLLARNTLQGLFNFFAVFVINVSEALTKIIVALIFVYLGFHALGAFMGIFASVLVTFLIAWFFMKREKLKNIGKFSEGNKVFKYSIPVFLTTLGFTSLFTTDVLFVRNFFPGVLSGYYSSLSVLGKIIYFGTFPIIMVLFPFVSERHAKGTEFRHLLLISLLLGFLVSFGIVLIYYFFPDLMIGILFGKSYLAVSPLLWLFGVFIAIYSLSSILANFYLSIHKNTASFFVIFSSILQIILINLFHKNLGQVIEMSIISTSFLLVLLITYYPFAAKKSS